jgi:transcriptional regulator with XRE-family HTH domain
MLQREQVRMARSALNWSLRDFAARANVAINTISRYENGAETLAITLDKFQKVFEAHGIDFPDEYTVSFKRAKDQGLLKSRAAGD